MKSNTKTYANNIILIGYTGCGKSFWGKKLAKKLNKTFIDLDDWIENHYKMNISEVFETHGEKEFRKKESGLLRKLNMQNTVLSVGGGSPTYNDNIELIKSLGIVIYLELSEKSIYYRLSNSKNKRPRIKDLNDAELKGFIAKDLNKRIPYYQMAHITIKAESLNLDTLIDILRLKYTIY